MAGDGVSMQTKRVLLSDEDLDKPRARENDTDPANTGGQTATSDPTRQVTQAEYDKMKAKQKADADAAYQRYKSGAARKALNR